MDLRTRRARCVLDFAKVASHQFARPCRFAHFAARRKSFEIRFYIQNGRSVHSVEFPHTNKETIDGFEFEDGNSDAVGAVFRALREDSHLWPVSASPRMARAFFNFVLGNSVQQKYNFDVRILLE